MELLVLAIVLAIIYALLVGGFHVTVFLVHIIALAAIIAFAVWLLRLIFGGRSGRGVS